MTLRRKNNRLQPEGNNSERYGGALDGMHDDELITLRQLKLVAGTIVSDPGNFTTLDPNRALKVTKGGVDYYLPIYIYP